MLAADARIRRFFATTHLPRLKTHPVNPLGAATGGPCVYNGRHVKSAHALLPVTDANIGAPAEDPVMSLPRFRVPQRKQ